MCVCAQYEYVLHVNEPSVRTLIPSMMIVVWMVNDPFTFMFLHGKSLLGFIIVFWMKFDIILYTVHMLCVSLLLILIV